MILNLLKFLLLDFEFLLLPSLVTFPLLPSPLATLALFSVKVGDSETGEASTKIARCIHLKVQKIVSECSALNST